MADIVNTKENKIASYSFNDIEQGSSVVLFYGGFWEEANNVSGGILANEAFYSAKVAKKVAPTTEANRTNFVSADFDLTFGGTRIINGDVICNIPFGAGDGQSGAETNNLTVSGQIILLHVDADGNETQLTNKHTGVYNESVGDNGKIGYISNTRHTLSNQRFNINEKLRLRVHMWGYNAGVDGRAKVYGIGCDPQNRSDNDDIYGIFPTDVDTILSVQVPFRIEE